MSSDFYKIEALVKIKKGYFAGSSIKILKMEVVYERFFLVIFGVLAALLFCEEIDFNKLKLERLTKELVLSKEQAVVMKKVIAEDSLFAKEGIYIRPEIDTIDELVDTRLERLGLLLDRVKETLDEKQYEGYLKYKGSIVNDKIVINIANKLSFTNIQKVMAMEIMSLVKKMKEKDSRKTLPPNDVNQTPRMGGGMQPGRTQGMGDPRGGDGRQTGDRSEHNTGKNEKSPLVEIFEDNLKKIFNNEQLDNYKNIEKSVKDELNKVFSVTSGRDDVNPDPSMGGGGGMRRP